MKEPGWWVLVLAEVTWIWRWACVSEMETCFMDGYCGDGLKLEME